MIKALIFDFDGLILDTEVPEYQSWVELYQAAKRAGLFCIAIPNALTCKLSLSHADFQMNSLADLPLEQIL